MFKRTEYCQHRRRGVDGHRDSSNLDRGVLSKSTVTVEKNLTRVAKKKFANDDKAAKNFVDTHLANLKTSVDMKDAVQHSDLIIEAIVEKLSAKRDLFQLLDQYGPSNCILASNTSSLSLKDIGCVLKDQTRFAGLHFFQPVPILQLVEVVRTQHTSEATFRTLMDFTRSLGKSPIVCKDTPGFVVNRLLIPYLLEAIRLVERGDASISDVDTGMKFGAGYPMGPFELCDLVGLDTIKLICDSFTSQLPGDRTFLCPSTLLRLVNENKLGKKSGEGFYKYDSQGKIINV